MTIFVDGSKLWDLVIFRERIEYSRLNSTAVVLNEQRAYTRPSVKVYFAIKTYFKDERAKELTLYLLMPSYSPLLAMRPGLVNARLQFKHTNESAYTDCVTGEYGFGLLGLEYWMFGLGMGCELYDHYLDIESNMGMHYALCRLLPVFLL